MFAAGCSSRKEGAKAADRTRGGTGWITPRQRMRTSQADQDDPSDGREEDGVPRPRAARTSSVASGVYRNSRASSSVPRKSVVPGSRARVPQPGSGSTRPRPVQFGEVEVQSARGSGPRLMFPPSRARGRTVDLIAYWSVLRRRRRIMVVGLFAAVALALISVVKFSSSGLAWRSPPVYKASTTLLVTQPGFPWGRSTLEEYLAGTATVVPRFADTTRMEYLASLYARIAESDVIAERVTGSRDTSKRKWGALPVVGEDSRALPLVEIGALETSPSEAIALANAVSDALQAYLASEQGKNRISAEDRVELRVLERADEAEVFQGVRLTRPVMIFLLISIVTFAVAFVVDNLRGGRSASARARGETASGLDIVQVEPQRSDATEADPIPEVAGRIQPPSPRTEEVDAEASSPHGRWAAREARLREYS
jgi:capsular polysaccharide biosynthesis protein